jgi:AcrR family transcriptional regulator
MSLGAMAQVRAGLVERLRARRAEIDEAIFARVGDRWFDRTESEDPKYVEGLRAADVAALDYLLVGIERPGESLEPIPVAALEPACRAARMGVGLDIVLRRYLAGYAVLEGVVMQEAEHGGKDGTPSTRASASRDVLQRMSALADRLIAAVSSAYSKEVWSAEAKSAGRVVAARCERTSRRERILGAMVEVVAERGFAGASVKLVTARAGVSSRTFYECFDGLEDCFTAVMDQATERAGVLIMQAFAREYSWQDGVRAALAALLVFFDSEPLLARVWLVEVLAVGSWALEHRERKIALLSSMIVEHWSVPGEERPEALAIAGVMASVLGLIHTHLVTKEPEPLIELLGPLMGLATRPYLDARGVAREIECGEQLARAIRAGEHPLAPASTPAQDMGPGVVLPAMLVNPSARRARGCLLFLAEHPGSSNREIATGIGVAHQSQISRLLAYFTQENLVVKRSEGMGKRNVLRLTPHGKQIARALTEQRD